jgi:hypothetical protein
MTLADARPDGRKRRDDTFSSADVPCTLVYTAAEMCGGSAVPPSRHGPEVDDPRFGRVLHAGVVPPVCPRTPVRYAGPERP